MESSITVSEERPCTSSRLDAVAEAMLRSVGGLESNTTKLSGTPVSAELCWLCRVADTIQGFPPSEQLSFLSNVVRSEEALVVNCRQDSSAASMVVQGSYSSMDTTSESNARIFDEVDCDSVQCLAAPVPQDLMLDAVVEDFHLFTAGRNSTVHDTVTPTLEELSPVQLARTPDEESTVAWWLLPGFEFRPNDREIVLHYLKNQVLNQALPLHHRFTEKNIYNRDADEIPLDFEKGQKKWGYFFVYKQLEYNNECFYTTPSGYWKVDRSRKPIKHEGRVIAFKTSMNFYRGRVPHGTKTAWSMSEYTLNKGLTDLRNLNDPTMNSFVVCKVHMRDHANDPVAKKSCRYYKPKRVEKSPAPKPKAMVRRALGRISRKIGKPKHPDFVFY